MAIAVVVGFGLAWLVVRTNTPGRGFMIVVTLLPLVIPGILNTVAWSLLLSPRIGPINILLSAAHLPRFNVYTIPGMVFVQSIHEIPLAFLMGLATFAGFDPSLEEAALASGSSMTRAFWRITMRIARPAVISAGLLILIQTISSFEVPQLIGTQGGIYVFVNYMYTALNRFPPDYGIVGALGTLVLVVCGGCLLASRRTGNLTAYQTISGKAFRSSVLNIGRWRCYPWRYWSGHRCCPATSRRRWQHCET
jgi:iron(III) transport system permease protein